MLQTLISRRVLLPEGIRPATLLLRDGHIAEIRIAEIWADGRLPSPTEAPDDGQADPIDLGDALLVPALTDTHVHINEPGRTEWEGFATATQAAAAGGVTLVMDMPLNSSPVTTTVAALEAKRAAAAGKLWVDCGFWGGVVPGNAGELRAMASQGVAGFKCFTCHSGIDDFPAVSADDLRVAMPILRAAGVPLLVHAELESALLNPYADASPRDYLRYLHSRPAQWEVDAIRMIVDLVRETGCRAHIVHLSAADALPVLRAAKAEGLPITAETCPHYLGLTAADVPEGGTAWKCAPPIRERENADRLWAGLLAGTIDFVVTDHSPCVPSLKLPDAGDFLGAWGGIASLQLGLRSVWTAAAARGVPLERVIGWMSTATAGFLGRADRGVIRVGAVADLAAFRPEPAHRLEAGSLLHRHPISPWVGRTLRGEVAGTWLRGERVWDGERICGEARGKVRG